MDFGSCIQAEAGQRRGGGGGCQGVFSVPCSTIDRLLPPIDQRSPLSETWLRGGCRQTFASFFADETTCLK